MTQSESGRFEIVAVMIYTLAQSFCWLVASIICFFLLVKIHSSALGTQLINNNQLIA